MCCYFIPKISFYVSNSGEITKRLFSGLATHRKSQDLDQYDLLSKNLADDLSRISFTVTSQWSRTQQSCCLDPLGCSLERAPKVRNNLRISINLFNPAAYDNMQNHIISGILSLTSGLFKIRFSTNFYLSQSQENASEFWAISLLSIWSVILQSPNFYSVVGFKNDLQK